MSDDPLKRYWDAVATESYVADLNDIPRLVEPRLRPASSVRRTAWAIGLIICVLATGFIPVPVSRTSGYVLSGASDSMSVSELMSALQMIPIPNAHNLSVSGDMSGTQFALFIAIDDGEERTPDYWTRQIEERIALNRLHFRAVDVTSDQPLAMAVMGRLGLTVMASGSTPEEIAAEVADQLSAVDGVEADVTEQLIPGGRRSTTITIRPEQK